MQNRIGIFTFAILLAAAISGCGQSGDSPGQADSVLKPCPGFVETGKAPLVYGAECGRILVKENPTAPQSHDISIEILRLPAISPAAQQDPLFLIQGGPGGSSIEMANYLHHFFSDVRKNRDLVFVDQRGTGQSNPLRCEQLSPAELLLPETEALEKYLASLRKCAQTFGDHLRHYSSLHAVQDLDAVRKALGYQTINLWGVSYGTRVALEYAHRFPQSTRTLVLDGVAPKEIALSKYSARDTLAALSRVNDECQAQAACADAFGDLLVNAEIIYSRLRAADESGEPLLVDYLHPVHQQRDTFLLSARIFSQLLFSALYSRDLTVLLPQAIHSAAKEDYRLLAVLYALSVDQSQKMNIADAMHFSVICNEDWHFVSPADVETTAPFFGLNLIKERAAICEFWPKASLPEDYWAPIQSQVPALLLSGQHDPITPSLWADKVAQGLPNSTRLVAGGGNHSISMEGCVPQIIAQFIERGSMQGVKTECVENIKPLPLVLGANQKKSSAASSASNSSAVEGVQP